MPLQLPLAAPAAPRPPRERDPARLPAPGSTRCFEHLQALARGPPSPAAGGSLCAASRALAPASPAGEVAPPRAHSPAVRPLARVQFGTCKHPSCCESSLPQNAHLAGFGGLRRIALLLEMRNLLLQVLLRRSKRFRPNNSGRQQVRIAGVKTVSRPAERHLTGHQHRLNSPGPDRSVSARTSLAARCCSASAA